MRRNARCFVPYADAVFKELCEPHIAAIPSLGVTHERPSILLAAETVRIFMKLKTYEREIYTYECYKVSGIRVVFGTTNFD